MGREGGVLHTHRAEFYMTSTNSSRRGTQSPVTQEALMRYKLLLSCSVIQLTAKEILNFFYKEGCGGRFFWGLGNRERPGLRASGRPKWVSCP